MIKGILCSFAYGAAAMLGSIGAICATAFVDKNKDKFKNVLNIIKTEFSKNEKEE